MIDHHLHHRPRGEVESREEFQTRALEWLLEVTSRHVLPGIARIELLGTSMANTLDDILAKQEATLTKVTALETVEAGMVAYVNGQKQTITDLQAQLAAAGQDPAKIKQVLDNMQKINDALDAHAAADALIANTPSE